MPLCLGPVCISIRYPKNFYKAMPTNFGALKICSKFNTRALQRKTAQGSNGLKKTKLLQDLPVNC